MAIYTQLSVTATPGKRHSFSAKSKGSGPFTALSVLAVPGTIHSFTAKTPAVGHEGLFTELSVIALPGGRHVFLPKVSVGPTGPSSAARQKYRIAYEDIDLEMAIKDDRDFMDLLIIMVEAGIFD